MGFRYRRSIDFGPFRVNVSRRGLGYSVGGRGFRVGRDASGRNYTSFGLPGTGLGYRKGCSTALLALALLGWALAQGLEELLA